MQIKKAVIPAAGLGTRVLPASKAMPKEMLPIVDKPAIQYIVEEAVAAGIEDILIITSRNKSIMEDHFDRAPELEARLEASGRDSVLEDMIAISKLANIQYLRQKETLGLGHAILCARNFVGEQPFAVLYADDVIGSEVPVCLQLCRAFEEYEKGVVGMKRVPMEDIGRYGSLDAKQIKENWYAVSDMVEKPKPEEVFTNFAILGRCILPPVIFSILENTPKGAGGEIQLTDAMKVLARSEGMIGVEFEGSHYDMGNKLGYMKANIECALKHPEISAEFRSYLLELTKCL